MTGNLHQKRPDLFPDFIDPCNKVDFLHDLSPCVVAMEACGGAHHIGRLCQQHSQEPRLMSPLCVRPHVKVYKNDDCDAEEIAEAAARQPYLSSRSNPKSSLTFKRGW
jgi:transposase